MTLRLFPSASVSVSVNKPADKLPSPRLAKALAGVGYSVSEYNPVTVPTLKKMSDAQLLIAFESLIFPAKSSPEIYSELSRRLNHLSKSEGEPAGKASSYLARLEASVKDNVVWFLLNEADFVSGMFGLFPVETVQALFEHIDEPEFKVGQCCVEIDSSTPAFAAALAGQMMIDKRKALRLLTWTALSRGPESSAFHQLVAAYAAKKVRLESLKQAAETETKRHPPQPLWDFGETPDPLDSFLKHLKQVSDTAKILVEGERANRADGFDVFGVKARIENSTKAQRINFALQSVLQDRVISSAKAGIDRSNLSAQDHYFLFLSRYMAGDISVVDEVAVADFAKRDDGLLLANGLKYPTLKPETLKFMVEVANRNGCQTPVWRRIIQGIELGTLKEAEVRAIARESLEAGEGRSGAKFFLDRLTKDLAPASESINWKKLNSSAAPATARNPIIETPPDACLKSSQKFLLTLGIKPLPEVADRVRGILLSEANQSPFAAIDTGNSLINLPALQMFLAEISQSGEQSTLVGQTVSDVLCLRLSIELLSDEVRKAYLSAWFPVILETRFSSLGGEVLSGAFASANSQVDLNEKGTIEVSNFLKSGVDGKPRIILPPPTVGESLKQTVRKVTQSANRVSDLPIESPSAISLADFGKLRFPSPGQTSFPSFTDQAKEAIHLDSLRTLATIQLPNRKEAFVEALFAADGEVRRFAYQTLSQACGLPKNQRPTRLNGLSIKHPEWQALWARGLASENDEIQREAFDRAISSKDALEIGPLISLQSMLSVTTGPSVTRAEVIQTTALFDKLHRLSKDTEKLLVKLLADFGLAALGKKLLLSRPDGYDDPIYSAWSDWFSVFMKVVPAQSRKAILVDALSDDHRSVRDFAAGILREASIGQSSAPGIFRGLALSKNEELNIGLDLIASTDDGVRVTACQFLKAAKNERAASALLDNLSRAIKRSTGTSDDQELVEAASALQGHKVKPAQSLSMFKEFKMRLGADSRYAAASAWNNLLSLVPENKRLGLCVSALEDPCQDVRILAYHSLENEQLIGELLEVSDWEAIWKSVKSAGPGGVATDEACKQLEALSKEPFLSLKALQEDRPGRIEMAERLGENKLKAALPWLK